MEAADTSHSFMLVHTHNHFLIWLYMNGEIVQVIGTLSGPTTQGPTVRH